MITSYIDDADERDLYNIFVDIIFEIFGRGSDKGWALDKLKTRVCNFFKIFINIFLCYSGKINLFAIEL